MAVSSDLLARLCAGIDEGCGRSDPAVVVLGLPVVSECVKAEKARRERVEGRQLDRRHRRTRESESAPRFCDRRSGETQDKEFNAWDEFVMQGQPDEAADSRLGLAGASCREDYGPRRRPLLDDGYKLAVCHVCGSLWVSSNR